VRLADSPGAAGRKACSEWDGDEHSGSCDKCSQRKMFMKCKGAAESKSEVMLGQVN
jgi:hypothetical protein